MTARGHDSLSLAAFLSSGAFAARLRWSASLFPHPLKRHCFYQDLNFLPPIPSSPNVFFSSHWTIFLASVKMKTAMLEETSKIRVLTYELVSKNKSLIDVPSSTRRNRVPDPLPSPVSRFWIRGCSWWFSVFSCCLLWNPQAHQEPCLMSFGSDGTHFMVGRGKDDRPWTKKGAHLSVGVCSLLPAVLAKLKAGPRGVQGPMRLLRADFPEEMPWTFAVTVVSQGAGGGGHSWGESREDKLVQETAGQGSRGAATDTYCFEVKEGWKESDGSKGPRGERRIILRSLSTKIVAFRMTQTRFRVSQVTPTPTTHPHPPTLLLSSIIYQLSICLSVSLPTYQAMKKHSQTYIVRPRMRRNWSNPEILNFGI